ncbi:MAG: DUF58 domain-containing protein [Planctomycetes bacterium]|nr:DUF58 domain-containing protein [Planctomycetota bacterium]
MSELFGAEFQALVVAAMRRVRSLRGQRDSERRASRQVGAPRGTFAGHRRYSARDDVRHVDWHAYARSGELFAKVFEEDEHRALTVLLDTTPSMVAGERFDAARRLAVLLGAIALDRLDGVRLVCGADGIHTLQGGAGARQLMRILLAQPTVVSDPFETARVPIDRGWLGSLCWISDFADPDAFATSLERLRASGRTCTGLLPMLAGDRLPDLGGWIDLRDEECGEHELVQVDSRLRGAMADELARLARRQNAVFANAGQPLLRFEVPAADDFRLSSWLADRWISRI